MSGIRDPVDDHDLAPIAVLSPKAGAKPAHEVGLPHPEREASLGREFKLDRRRGKCSSTNEHNRRREYMDMETM